MPPGYITEYVDVAQLVLYAFWIFFAGLIFYIRREDKREGYPLVADAMDNQRGRVTIEGWPSVPAPKTFLMKDGTKIQKPDFKVDARDANLNLRRAGNFPGAPYVATGDALKDGVGAAAYTERDDNPESMWEGGNKIAPLRVATDFHVAEGDPNPVGMDVVALDGKVAGKVTDLWVDRPEAIIRYLEVEVGSGQNATKTYLPFFLTRVQGDARRKWIKVNCITSEQFKSAPSIANPDQITRAEEDRMAGYFGGGHLHATPERSEPLV
jgi:photosynthetic reaction center H subunit